MVTFVALTGLLVFMLFFLAATINAVVISLLLSLAVVGGFLAIFFASIAAIYVGALFCNFSYVLGKCILLATGWIGFFYTVWLVTRKSFGFAKHTLSVTGSAISTYSAARYARHQMHKD